MIDYDSLNEENTEICEIGLINNKITYDILNTCIPQDIWTKKNVYYNRELYNIYIFILNVFN